VLCIATDVTERKDLHAQVIQAEKLAALGELIAGVAHEINNPLAAIIGNAELLEMHTDEQVREDAATIVSMGQRATRIVRSLLTFARGTGGERRLEALNTLVQGTMEMATYKLRKSNVALELCLDQHAPEVLVNANEIQQVILNLINNAEHALRGKAGERRLIISTAGPKKGIGRYACLSVEDNGHGIPEDVIGSIFDPFFTTKGVGEGTGLGLSICHGIAEAHGGKLAVKSTVGQGTTFTLMIPLDSAASEERAKAA
jgi:two-component system NtrC family sensor kinase